MVGLLAYWPSPNPAVKDRVSEMHFFKPLITATLPPSTMTDHAACCCQAPTAGLRRSSLEWFMLMAAKSWNGSWQGEE